MIRIGHLSTFYHTAVILMADSAFLGDMPGDAAWTLFGTGPAIVNAFEKGELDLAYIGLPPVVIGIARGVPIRCIAGGHMEGSVLSGRQEHTAYSGTGDLSPVFRQFRGKSIGVPGNGSSHDVILRECLDGTGMTGAVQVRNFSWADLALESFVKGEIDAVMGTPALSAAVEVFSGGKILCPPHRLWPHNPSYGIVADRSFMDRKPEIISRFLIAHEAAAAFLREDPAGAAALIARFVGFVDADFVLRTISISPRYCAQLPREYIESTMRLAQAMKKLGFIGRDMAEHEIFSDSLIGRIHPEGHHYGG